MAERSDERQTAEALAERVRDALPGHKSEAFRALDALVASLAAAERRAEQVEGQWDAKFRAQGEELRAERVRAEKAERRLATKRGNE